MFEGFDERLPACGEHVGKRRRVLQRDAQHQGVDEQADHRFQRSALATADREANHDVPLAAVDGEHRRQRRVQVHEERRSAFAAQRLRVLQPGRRQAPAHAGAGVDLHRRARPFQRQPVRCGHPLQSRRPVVDLGLQRAGAGVLPAPRHVVDVLRRRRRKRIVASGQEACVQHADLALEDVDGRAVAGDVVQVEHQHPVLVAELRAGAAEQRRDGQIEMAVVLAVEQALQRGVPALGGQPGEVLAFERHLHRGHHALLQVAVDVGEDRPQCFVAGDHRIQRRPQAVRIKRAAQAVGADHVVGRMRAFELVDQPHAALRGGRR